MKYIFFIPLMAALCLCHTQATAQYDQEKLDLPGDNLSLYAVLKLFQESETLESFEKSLNDESSKINNLDLDGDNQIDYIQVSDSIADDIHNIVLKVSVNDYETQNIAIIVVQKENDGQVEMQVIGDEDLYGKDYIVEPDYDKTATGTPNPGYTGNQAPVTVETNTYYQIAAWPVIRFIFVPTYTRWHSPWHWGYYPGYWRPWHPFFWHTYYGYHYHWNYYYSSHFRRWNTYRFPGWRDRYYGGGFRSRSALVQTRYQRGDYKQTYSKPQLAQQGSAMFRKDHPKAPSANTKLPPFDKTGRPVITRPAVTRPGTTDPGTTRPVITNPGGESRPVTRPVTKPVTRPVTKPETRPVTRPVTKPVITQPVTRPVTKPATNPPVTRPGGSKPVTRPVTTPQTRPVPRPSTPASRNQGTKLPVERRDN